MALEIGQGAGRPRKIGMATLGSLAIIA